MFEELKIRYRSLSMKARLIACALLGIIPGVYTYFNDVGDLQAALDGAVAIETQARERLAKSKALVANMPQAQEKLAFTREQLKKAAARLPDQVPVDEILLLIGKAAKAAGVEVIGFTPKSERTIDGDYPYNEIRVTAKMRGKFGALGHWLDVMGGTNRRCYITSGKTEPDKNDLAKVSAGIDPESAKNKLLLERLTAIGLRENLVNKLDAEIAFYRSAPPDYRPPEPPKDPKAPKAPDPAAAAKNPAKPAGSGGT